MIEENVSSIVKKGLCTGCGTCIAMCPIEAIKNKIDRKKGVYVPEINENICNKCGICIKVCPGHEVNFKQFNLEIFKKEPGSVLIGNYLNCYMGYSTDYNVRYNSSSGGLITQLLIFALEEGIVDGALVTRMKRDNPLEPEPFIAKTKEEIIQASGSKYCPVPANVALKEILNSQKGQKFIVVGLPCHIHGIRKAEQINKDLKEKIIAIFGLFCSKCPSFNATDYVLRNYGLNRCDIQKFSYRLKGYPGGMAIQLKNDKRFYINFWDYYDTVFGQFFVPPRCRLCIDYTCELADLSFGDVFFDKLASKDEIGKSFIISRTKNGESILQQAVNNIEIRPVDINKFENSRDINLLFKKCELKSKALFYNGEKPKYSSKFVNNFRIRIMSSIFMLLYRIGYFLSYRKLNAILKIYAALIKSFARACTVGSFGL